MTRHIIRIVKRLNIDPDMGIENRIKMTIQFSGKNMVYSLKGIRTPV